MKKIVRVLGILAFTALFTTLQAQCIQCDENNTNLGTYSSVMGMSNTATANSDGAFVGGYGSLANGVMTFAFGNYAKAEGTNALAIGRYVSATAASSMIIGTGGGDASHPLVNNEQNSLMIGFNSTKPTFFVKGGGNNYSGKVGIGDIANPLAKLHIRADDNENASILLEPTSSAKYARIQFGLSGNAIEAKEDGDLTFNSASDIVFNQANVGIGTTAPQSLLDVNGKTTTQELQISGGDILIDEPDRGIIMKSPDGQCWKVTVDNSGNLVLNPGDCATKIQEQPLSEVQPVVLFPNPASDELRLRKAGTEKYFAAIVNPKGILLKTIELKDQETVISLSGYAKGVYVVRITDRNNKIIQTEKIIVE